MLIIQRLNDNMFIGYSIHDILNKITPSLSFHSNFRITLYNLYGTLQPIYAFVIAGPIRNAIFCLVYNSYRT